MKLAEYIRKGKHLKTDITNRKITSFKHWVQEYDKAYRLKPIP